MMCGRFTMRTAPAEVLEHFQLPAGGQLELRFNVAPTQSVAVIRDSAGRRQLTHMRWGLVPFWAKDSGGAARLINARAETVATKPAFRAAFQKRRCLVPADGYYEWETRQRRKLPWHIRLRDDRLFAFAGLWESWRAPSSDLPLETFTIITTESNDLTRDLHERMPVVIDEDHYEMWIDSEFQDTDALQSLLKAYPSDQMTLNRVSTHVNNVRHDDALCVVAERELF